MSRRRGLPPPMPEPLNRYLVETATGALFAVAAESAQDAARAITGQFTGLDAVVMVTRFTATGELYVPPKEGADEPQLARQ